MQQESIASGRNVPAQQRRSACGLRDISATRRNLHPALCARCLRHLLPKRTPQARHGRVVACKTLLECYYRLTKSTCTGPSRVMLLVEPTSTMGSPARSYGAARAVTLLSLLPIKDFITCRVGKTTAVAACMPCSQSEHGQGGY